MILTTHALYDCPVDDQGWRTLPNGNRARIGHGVELGYGVKLGDHVKLGDCSS